MPEAGLSAFSSITDVICCPSWNTGDSLHKDHSKRGSDFEGDDGHQVEPLRLQTVWTQKAVLPGDRNDLSGRWLVNQEQHPEGRPCHGRELAPYASSNNTCIEGPCVVLGALAAQTSAFVLHELATNAAKYGAYSKAQGRVSVRWSCAPNGQKPGG